ncbi:MAG: carboxymuconolactone decarboxylase family protein [Halofilum sp. (in: g-proteobacteria)]
MARWSKPERGDLPQESQQILEEIEQGMGRVPNLFRTYAPYPPLLRANWGKVKVALMEGELSRRVKEAIALLVSQDNGCEYCIAAHSGAMRQIGVDNAPCRRTSLGSK